MGIEPMLDWVALWLIVCLICSLIWLDEEIERFKNRGDRG